MIVGLAPTTARTMRQIGLLTGAMMALGFAGNFIAMVVRLNRAGFDGEAIKIDFVTYWAAAKLALAGRALEAFDPDILRAAQALSSGAVGGDVIWHYPALWHMAVTPLGLLPFEAAYLVFALVSWFAYAAATRRLAAPIPGGIGLILAGPAVLVAINLGVISLIWSAGLIAALAALSRGREARAGLLLALLTVKPQLGILIPFALIADRRWRTLGWGAAATLAITGLGIAVMGIAHLELFFVWIGKVSELVRLEIVRFDLMITWFALLRVLGIGHDTAFAVQIGVTLASAAAVTWVWWRREASFDLKAATLLIAVPLATPYAYHYEMIFSLAGAMFLMRDGFGATIGARLWLAALWLGPLPGLALADVFPAAYYAPPLLSATLVLCLIRARRAAAP